MEPTPTLDPAIRGRDYSIDFRNLTPAELAERHRARAEDRAKAEYGQPFAINWAFERAEAERIAATEPDTGGLKFWLWILAIIGLFGLSAFLIIRSLL